MLIDYYEIQTIATQYGGKGWTRTNFTTYFGT